MILYLLLPMPALLAALLFRRIGASGMFALWAITTVALINLMPLGSRDFTTYIREIDSIKYELLSEAIVQDPLYASVVWLARYFHVPSTVFYFCLASLALAVKLVALGRLCGGRTLPIALYMCSFLFLHEFTQIRAALAIGLWMLGLAALPYSRGRYFTLTLLASFVHIQAALGLLLYPIARVLKTRARARAFAVAAIVMVALSLAGAPEHIVQQVLTVVPDPRVTVYLALAEAETVRPNPFSSMSLLAIATACVGLWPRDRVAVLTALNERPDTFVFTGLLVGSFALSVLTLVPIAALRISEHFFALLPVGLWLAAEHVGANMHKRFILWVIACLFLYLFLIHSPYLLDPVTGA